MLQTSGPALVHPFRNLAILTMQIDHPEEADHERATIRTLLGVAFDRQPPELGVADLIAFTAQSALLRSVEAAVVLAELADGDRPRFQKVQLLAGNLGANNRLELLTNELDHQLQLGSEGDQLNIGTRHRIEFKSCDGSLSAVLKALDEAGPGVATVIPDVDLVARSTTARVSDQLVVRGPGWFDTATESISHIVTCVDRTRAYALLLTSSDLHVDGELHPSLGRIEGLGVFTFKDNSILHEVKAEIQAVHAALTNRRLAEAITQLDSLTTWSPALRKLIRADVFAHGGWVARAQRKYEEIAPVLDLFSPSLSLYAAKIAVEIGMVNYARENIRLNRPGFAGDSFL